MPTRLRLLKGATALLYIGPLFAGLSGLGWGMVAPFVLVFMVWLFILRPEQWPGTPSEWLTVSAIAAAVTQLLSQILLVTLLLALGRGLGAVAGFLPVVNPIFPLAVSFLAIPLCRMLWDAREAADRGVFLDDEAAAALAPRALAEAASAIVPLLNLPDEAPDADVLAAVSRVMSASGAPTGAELRLTALAAALAHPDRSHAALRRALVLWASEPEIVAPGQVPTSMASAFAIANRNADLLWFYVPRALALIAAFPNRAGGFPAPAQLRLAAASGPGADPQSDLPAHLRADLCDGLNALARAVEQALEAQPELAGPRRDRVAQPAAGHA